MGKKVHPNTSDVATRSPQSQEEGACSSEKRQGQERKEILHAVESYVRSMSALMKNQSAICPGHLMR